MRILRSSLEIIGVLIVLFILYAFFSYRGCRIGPREKEAEAKANLHNIQLTVERYAVDHNQYPPYLIGGTGGATPINEGTIPSRLARREISDPLLREGYIDSYPRNPFLWQSEPRGPLLTVQESIRDPMRPGALGDKHGYRFGEDGTIMGNVMADLRFTEWRPTVRNKSGKLVPGDPIPTGANVNYKQYDLYPERNPAKDRLVLPGQFLYKSASDLFGPDAAGKEETVIRIEDRLRQPEEPTDYFLGVFGTVRSKGKDVIGPEPLITFHRTDSDGSKGPRTARTWLGQENVPPYDGSPFRIAEWHGDPGEIWFTTGNPNGIRDGIVLVLTGPIDDIKTKR